MPLACNAASMKAVPKPNDNNHKKALGTNTTAASGNRRDSISSVSSSHTQHNATKNRLSLPKSLPSTTVVTKSNVERRRSIRRSMAKENEPVMEATTTPSQKRKHNELDSDDMGHDQKLPKNPAFFNSQHNALLQFSPPNQARNAQREQERIQQKEQERYVRMHNAYQWFGLLHDFCIMNVMC